MNKKFMMVATVVLVALSMTSCFVGSLIKDAAKVAKESKEVLDGKVFQIESASLEYSDGVKFAFKDYGKYQRIEQDNYVTILAPKATIELDPVAKTYRKTETDREGLYTSEYVVMESWWEFEKLAEKFDSDISASGKSTRTICGKSCTVFTSGDGEEVGSWKRILMCSKNEGEREITAVSIEEKAADSLFEIPADYKLEEY